MGKILSVCVNCTAYGSQRWVAEWVAQSLIGEYLFQIPCIALQVYFNPDTQDLVYHVFDSSAFAHTALDMSQQSVMAA